MMTKSKLLPYYFTYGGLVQLVRNWAGGSGGAVDAEDSELRMEGLYRFDSNAAKQDGYGGAIYAQGTTMGLGGRCLTHDLCTIFIGFTQRDNCAIAIVNIIKLKFQAALVSEFIVQTDHSFAT